MRVNKKKEGVTITTELVGIKNLKMTGNYRLEFDVFEIDSPKVAELIMKLNKAFMMALVEVD
jgi:hypothetical protein